MPRYNIDEHGTQIWLSANDTYNWAHKPGASWPCSQLSGKRISAEFDKRGNLVDLTIDGRYSDCDANEFNAMVSEFLRRKDPKHPAIRS